MESPETASGKAGKLFETSRQFFRRIRLVHGALAVLMLASGFAATALSYGSNGTSKIPYFFSAYISGCWHILLIVLSQVSIYYLSGDKDRIPNATKWVGAYSICSSVFVIFNVMGIIFVVVNGLCIHSQQCYFDRNYTANRLLAIFILLLSGLTNLFCILCAKRAHSIDSELGSDISIKLGHYMSTFRERIRSRPQSGVSPDVLRSNSISTLGSCSSLHKNDASVLGGDLSVKDKEILIANFMEKRKNEQKNRSKSHPNLRPEHLEMRVETPELEGNVFSIYSDSETTGSIDSRRKKRYVRHKHNVVKPADVNSGNVSKLCPENVSKLCSESSPGSGNNPMGLTGRSEDSGVSVDDDMWSSSSTFRTRPELVRRNSNIGSAQNSDIASDITETDSGVVRNKKTTTELRQQMLDKQQALLEKHTFMIDSPPPPYQEEPELPNMVLDIQPTQEECVEDNSKRNGDQESQSNV